MTNVEALNAADITKIGAGVIVALVVIGVLLSLVISAIIARVVILIVVVVLAVVVWQQRGHVQDRINTHKCELNATFFGIHLDPPASVLKACRRYAR